MTISITSAPTRTGRPVPVATTEQDGQLFAGLHLLAGRTAQGDRLYGRISDSTEPTDHEIQSLIAATWATTDASGAYTPIDRDRCARFGITNELAVVLGALAGLAPDALAADECFRIDAAGYRLGWDTVVRSFWEGAGLHASTDRERTSITMTSREPGDPASITVPVRAWLDVRGRFIGSTRYVEVEEYADTYSDTALTDALSTASAETIDTLLERHIRTQPVKITGREWQVTVWGDQIEVRNSLVDGARWWQDFRTKDQTAADELYTVTGKFRLARHDHRSGPQRPVEQIRGLTIDQILCEARFRFVVAEVATQRRLAQELSDAIGVDDRAF